MSESDPLPEPSQPQTIDHTPAEVSAGTDLPVPGTTHRTDPVASPARHRPQPAIPGYEILGELGRGGMGVVYKARDTRLNRTVAVKTVRGAADGVSVARFWAEAEVMAAVGHPHVVQVFELGEVDGVPFLAMEYLPGGSFADRLKRSAPSPVEAAAVVEKVARGVAAAHGLGIIHRDLKPHNVLLDATGEPKVTDFGLAKRPTGDDLTNTRAVMGTPAYMAPEQAAGGAKFVGPPADVWALGVVLYEAVTGTRPFDGDDALSVLNQVQSRSPARLSSRGRPVPRDLELICLKCLEKEPADRYPGAAALADDLRRFLDGKPVTARPIGAATQAVKWVRRNPVPALLIAAVVLGSLATTAFALVARERTRQAAAALVAQTAAERDRAAEREKRDRAEREAAVTAAVQAHDLPRVVEVVQAAERDGLAVSPELRLAAAAALSTLARTDEARERMTALLADPALPQAIRPRVELRLADDLFGIDDARALKLLAAARASGTLPPADLAYADAISAATMPAAIASLQAAVTHDPAHFPARRLLGLFLMVSGRLDEAIQVGETSRLLTANHPEVLWPLLLAHAFKGNAARARETFALLRPHLDKELTQALGMVARFLPMIDAQFKAAVSEQPGPAGPELQTLLGEMLTAGGTPAVGRSVRDVLDRLSGRLHRTPPAFRDALDDYWAFNVSYLTGLNYPEALSGDEVGLARLGANLRRRPEGFMGFIHAFTLFCRTNGYRQRYGVAGPHGGRVRDMYLMAGDAAAEAATTPGLIDTRAACHELAALCYWVAGQPGWAAHDSAAAVLAKGAEMVRRRLTFPDPYPPPWRTTMLALASKAAGDFTTARRVLDMLDHLHPGDTQTLTVRAEVELQAGAYPAALAAARQAVAKDPGNERMRAVEAECLSKLRRDPALPPESAPPPRPVADQSRE